MSESQSTGSGSDYVPEQPARRGRGRGGGARGRGLGRGCGSGRSRRSVQGGGQHHGGERLGEDDLRRVEQLQARRIADEQARIQSLTTEHCRALLERCLLRDPSLFFDVVASAPPPDPHGQPHIPNQPEWCTCMKCQEMPTDVERKCCGHPPQDCISLLLQVELLILNEGVLRLARRIWNDVRAREDDPNPGEDNKQFRYAAYRQFVVWQYGSLGRRHRVVIPSCCVWAIRDRYPDPHQQYVGFIPHRI